VNPWRDPPERLAGRHVALRPLSPGDLPALVAAAADGEQTRLFFAHVAGLRDPEGWMAAILRERDYGRSMPFAVELPDGRVVGTTRLMRMNEGHRRVELGGTFYAASVQRTGVNTEAKRLLLEHAFEVLGCQCVQIRTDWLNLRSRRAIERLGAKQDGVLRGHQIVNGRVRDTVVYSIQAHEWPGVRMNIDYLLERHG
jgi:N-acetyltransferase